MRLFRSYSGVVEEYSGVIQELLVSHSGIAKYLAYTNHAGAFQNQSGVVRESLRSHLGIVQDLFGIIQLYVDGLVTKVMIVTDSMITLFILAQGMTYLYFQKMHQ